MPKLLQFHGDHLRPSLPLYGSAQTLGGNLGGRWLCGCLLVAVSLLSSGCLFKKQARVFRPPPVAAKVALPPDPGPTTVPTSLDLNPVPPETNVASPTSANLPTLPPPPIPKPPPPKPRTPEPTPVIVETPPPVIAPTPAKPAQIYTVEERRVYSKDFDDSMARIRRALTKIESRKLTTIQQQTAKLVRALQSQAEEAKSGDLATALDLAHRADLLARDLASRLP
ncbi:MAG: hypothetical protein ABI824_03685 [Acidobacteriota bacterium]